MQSTVVNDTGQWISTVCNMCIVGCGIRVLVDKGVVLAIEGDPRSPVNKGTMCAKGNAGIMSLYNPNRVRTPLKRTNPEKGINVDPRWQPISWNEALSTVTEKLQQIKDDPRQLYIQPWENGGSNLSTWLRALGTAFGTPHTITASSPSCGKVIHPVEFFSGGGFHQQPDLHYCKYCILVGTQTGIGGRHAFTHMAKDMAEARERGMKLVAIDPIGVFAGSKADEWIPIRPGTDAALALSMLNVLLNERGIYDTEFLKKGSNAPYLVGSDGRYLRDPSSQKPLVFDKAAGVAKPYDDPSIKDYALEGEYIIGELKGRPSFEYLKEHVAKYPPEKVEKITTIPAETIRRIAGEFGEAAMIGSTMTILGEKLPFRPACVDWARGPQGHKHGFAHGWTLRLLNIIIGSVNVPGGILSTGASGASPWRWEPKGGTDGLLEHGGSLLAVGHTSGFPGRTPTTPRRQDLAELFPVAGHSTTLPPLVNAQHESFNLNYKIEVLIHSPTNVVLGHYGDLKVTEAFLKSIPFIAGFAQEINETNLFDDVVLPVPGYLERFDFPSGYSVNSPVGTDDYAFQVRQPVVQLSADSRNGADIVMEIAERIGVVSGLYRIINHTYHLQKPFALEEGKKYSYTEISDRIARAWFGKEHDLEWFKKNGILSFKRDADIAYIGPFLKARLPVYLEHMLPRGEELKEVTQKMGLDWDTEDYKPIPDWQSCPSYEAREKGEYDLVAVHYKLPHIYGHYGNENPYLNELCEKVPLSYKLLINEDVAKRKGITDGDEVWLESPVQKIRVIVKLSQCIHPEVVGVAGFFGHWSPGMPIANGKGISFNHLLPHDMEHLDMISTALDHCVQVKVYK